MSKRMASIGGCAIESVPLRNFSKFKGDINFEDVWKLCGPSAERNLSKVPVWKVICAAYLEGLHHGSEILKDEGK
jgi:hypothetical protein